MKLLFVYNADSGLFNTVKDIGQKLFVPASYDCFLCSLTHGAFREQRKWKEFREHSPLAMEFLHRDEFEQRYGRRLEYPVVLREEEELVAVLTRNQLQALSSLDELIAAISAVGEADP